MPTAIVQLSPKGKRKPGIRCWHETPAHLGLLGVVAMLLGNIVWAQSDRSSPTGAGQPASLDQAIALLAEARLRFQSVRDYECRLIDQERVNGVLLPESVMTMKCRNKPFSVYLCYESPDADKGMEVCFVQGQNQGMMRVHPAHMLGFLGFWSLNPHDPRAMEKSRHCITDAGIEGLLECTARYWEMERHLNKTLVHITDEEIGGRACTRIVTIHPERQAGSFYGYRCVLWLDKRTYLAAGAETYDWPRRGGPPEGDLLERYRYLDLHCNVGLTDEIFHR